MKNLYLLFFVFMILASCSNKKKTPTYREVNVQNVNGNIPDTTNAIDLSTKRIDSGSAAHDTSRHH